MKSLGQRVMLKLWPAAVLMLGLAVVLLMPVVDMISNAYYMAVGEPYPYPYDRDPRGPYE